MPRGSSSDSEDSILSHITVHEVVTTSTSSAGGREARLADMSSASRSSVGASSLQSTPPTSLDGSAVDRDASKKLGGRRVSRARSSLSTLNSATAELDVSLPSSSAKRKAARSKEDMHSKTSSRAVSGVTLVEGDEVKGRLRNQLDIDMHWDMADEPSRFMDDDEDGHARRRSSRRSNFGTTANDVADAISAATSSLGKRTRDALDAVKDKASSGTPRSTRAQASQSPQKKAKAEPKGRMFPNLQRSKAKEEKKEQDLAKPAEPPKPPRPTRIVKVYQTKGLYAGQVRSFDPTVKQGTNKKNVQKPAEEAVKENSVLPLPMFGTYKRLTVNDTEMFAPFRLPADILVPLRKEQNPKNWNRLNRNRFIGDAAATWDLKEHKKLDVSFCGCKEQCDEGCINRGMSYECNDRICDVGDRCGNRPFAELKWRYKNKNFSRLREGEKPEGNLWGEGVETIDTRSRGFGVRAMRPFRPNQIIVEYCGEIINQEEADRRMNEDYKDKQDYYLMDFHDGMIIDATRGSICRFVNHSCDPNCRVEKWIVDGEPRMALFAGESGIMTGEELTYDYNFEVFSKNSTQQCLCGASNCRGVLGPKPKNGPSKAKQLAGAVKGAIQGVKRKVREMVGGDDGDSKSSKPKKRVKIGPKEIINRMKKQISSVSAPAVTPVDPSAAQLLKEQRAKRAAERVAREEADRLGKKTHRRHTMSTTLAVSDLPRSAPKASRKSAGPLSLKRHTSASPAKMVSALKNRVQGSVVKGSSAATPTPRTSSQTPLLKASGSSSSSSADAKSMRQSRISFGFGGISFNVSPKKHSAPADEDDADDENADASEISSKGPKIPKRSSSLLKAPTNIPRPSTAKSLAKGVSKVAATAKLGVKGDKAIRKTIRAVSGAE